MRFRRVLYIKLSILNTYNKYELLLCAVAHPDLQQSGKPDADPHQSKKSDPDLLQCQKSGSGSASNPNVGRCGGSREPRRLIFEP
jgi:hypothetical protein